MPASREALLARAQQPSDEALRLHPFYRGKLQTALKCPIRGFGDFAIWYTPGVAAPCRAIQADPALAYAHTNEWDLHVRVAAAAAAQAQAEGVARLDVPRAALEAQAAATMRTARETTHVLMREGLIPPPPA